MVDKKKPTEAGATELKEEELTDVQGGVKVNSLSRVSKKTTASLTGDTINRAQKV